MSLHAVDAIEDALDDTRDLLWPPEVGRWIRLALLALFGFRVGLWLLAALAVVGVAGLTLLLAGPGPRLIGPVVGVPFLLVLLPVLLVVDGFTTVFVVPIVGPGGVWRARGVASPVGRAPGKPGRVRRLPRRLGGARWRRRRAGRERRRPRRGYRPPAGGRGAPGAWRARCSWCLARSASPRYCSFSSSRSCSLLWPCSSR